MNAIRMLFLVMAAVMLLGIWLTGFSVVHWVLYLPAIGLLFAAVTGICPGYILMKKIGFKGHAEGMKL